MARRVATVGVYGFDRGSFLAALHEGGVMVVLDIRQRLFDEAELYRHWSARGLGSKRDIAAEHADLVAAALRRDAVTATRLLQEHLRQTAALALETTR